VKLSVLDNICSEYIRRRAIAEEGGCQRCLTPKHDIQKDNGKVLPAWKQLQCSHFIGRSRRAVRYEEDNLVGLCAACHIYLTSHPLEHVRWFTEHLGEEKMDFLLARNRSRVKPDEKLLTLYYREKIKELDEV